MISGDAEVLQRKVMRGLMCRKDISISSLTALQKKRWVEPLVSQGYVEEAATDFRLTELGRSMLPHVWMDSSPAFRAY